MLSFVVVLISILAFFAVISQCVHPQIWRFFCKIFVATAKDHYEFKFYLLRFEQQSKVATNTGLLSEIAVSVTA